MKLKIFLISCFSFVSSLYLLDNLKIINLSKTLCIISSDPHQILEWKPKTNNTEWNQIINEAKKNISEIKSFSQFKE